MICSEISCTAPGEWETNKRVGLALFADRFERVEILGHQHQLHDLPGAGVADRLLELLDRAAQPLDDRLALIGDALALQGLALGLGLRLLDHQDFFRLAARGGRDLLALGGVDVVHRRFDLGVGDDVGHQHIDDLDSRRPPYRRRAPA